MQFIGRGADGQGTDVSFEDILLNILCSGCPVLYSVLTWWSNEEDERGGFVKSGNNIRQIINAFKAGNSTDTRILAALYAETNSSVFTLLDLSAAFDTENHQIPFDTLKRLGVARNLPYELPLG